MCRRIHVDYGCGHLYHEEYPCEAALALGQTPEECPDARCEGYGKAPQGPLCPECFSIGESQWRATQAEKSERFEQQREEWRV